MTGLPAHPSKAQIAVGCFWPSRGSGRYLEVCQQPLTFGLVEQHGGSVTIEDVTDNQVRCVRYHDGTVHMVMVDQLPGVNLAEMVVRCRRLADDDEQDQVET